MAEIQGETRGGGSTPLRMERQTLAQPAGVVLATLAGYMDHENARQVDDWMNEVLQTDRPRHLLLDLSGLTFAGSELLGSLLFWKEEVARGGGQMVLFGLQPEIVSLLRVVSFDRLLTIRPDRAAALAALPAS